MSIPAGNQVPVGAGNPLDPYSGIVTVNELRLYMGNPTWNASQTINVASVLMGTQGELETYLGRPVELVQVRERLAIDSGGVLNVSVSPVRKVISVSSAEAPDVSLIQTVEPDPLVPVIWDRSPLIDPDNGRRIDLATPGVDNVGIVPGGIYVGEMNFGRPFGFSSWYLVDYVGGYDGTQDPGLKNAIKMVAARSIDKNHGVTVNLRSGEAQVASEADDRPKGWTEDELMLQERLRRRTIV